MLIWAWSSGWFFFIFIVTSLISYLVFELISNKITKITSLIDTLKNQGLSIITFLFSTFVFVKL